MLSIHPFPLSISDKVTSAKQSITVGNGRKENKFSNNMAPVISLDLINIEPENKFASLRVKTDEELRLERLQYLTVIKTSEL